MKPKRSDKSAGPFAVLAKLLDVETLPNAIPEEFRELRDSSDTMSPEDEERLFREAMADVTPVYGNHACHEAVVPPDIPDDGTDSEDEAAKSLGRIVEGGSGFVVSHTPEYIEGAGIGVSPEITERLHRGDFSIQEHIDLHGMTVPEAEEAFNAFLRESLNRGTRALLIVHGRGLSSPGRPVLKGKVYEWLTKGYWRKRVIAFCSARLCDGGAGGTYVLLRQRPVTKARIKKKHHYKSLV